MTSTNTLRSTLPAERAAPHAQVTPTTKENEVTYVPADPMVRLKAIRDYMAKEGAKMPKVDHNGRIIEPEPVVEVDEAAGVELVAEVPAGPRNPAPDMSQGGGSAPITETYRMKLQRAKVSGDVMAQMNLANRPIIEGQKLGITPQQWLVRNGDLPA